MPGVPDPPHADPPHAVAHSPRLLLCPPTYRDEPAVRALRQDSRVMHFLGGPLTDDAAEERFAQDLAHWQRHGYGKCVVTERASGAFVGWGGLQLFEGEIDLGYVIAPGWWGCGLATETARALLWYGFGHLHVPLVRAVVQVRNLASQRVLHKAGMRYLHERVLWGDRQRCYAVTAAQWESHTFGGA